MEDLKHPVPARKKADFRGTVSFASLNAHNNVVSRNIKIEKGLSVEHDLVQIHLKLIMLFF